MTKEFQNSSNPNIFFIGILCATVLQIFYSHYIPLQLIPAPHDDLLFYRLAENIANLKWLGVFDQTTLIKGFSYPLFLSASIFFKFPLRLLEACLICITSFYFVMSVRKMIPNSFLSVALYAVIIFYPFQYSLIDFRLLRDMIYFPLILIIISALFFIYLDAGNKANEGIPKLFHPTILGFAFFFFWHAREEGIWIVPTLLFFSFFICRKYLHEKNIGALLKKIAAVILVFGLLQSTLVGLNAYKYRTIVVTIFKNSNFQSGYASLHRIDSTKSWYEDISKQDWDALFLASPAVAELQPFVQGEGYRFWTTISCDAMRSQGYNLTLSGCPNVMPPGNVQFALMDALFQIGYRNPAGISQYMGRVAIEIDSACEAKKLKCQSKPSFMLSRNIFQEGIPASVLWSNILRATQIAAIPKSISLSEFSSYFDLNMVPKMRDKLGGYLFDPKNVAVLGGAEKLHESGVIKFFISSRPNVVKIFALGSYLYSWFMAIAWLFIIFAMYLVLKSRSALGMLIGGFLILSISRILLISVLDYYAMAPISSLYLMSGTSALFVAEVISIVYLICYWIGRRNCDSQLA
jgi:hypothetical protein